MTFVQADPHLIQSDSCLGKALSPLRPLVSASPSFRFISYTITEAQIHHGWIQPQPQRQDALDNGLLEGVYIPFYASVVILHLTVAYRYHQKN